MVALGYIWTMLWSRWFFGEPFSRRKVGGIALILVGVVLLKAGS
jgi:multidrug transporter EmrE-like cation transporter